MFQRILTGLPNIIFEGLKKSECWCKKQVQKSKYACCIMQNSIKLPIDFITRTDQFLASITFSQDDILKIIQSFDPSKSHGPDKKKCCMIKLWWIAFAKVLANERHLALFPTGTIICSISLRFIFIEIICKSWITKGKFPS